LALFTRTPYVYAGPDFTSFPIGMISSVLNHHGRRLQRFYPFTISKIMPDGRLADQMFCLGVLHTDGYDSLGLFLSHPYWLDRSCFQEAASFFLAGLEKLARSRNIKQIRLEFHLECESNPAFPTSASVLSYDLREMPLRPEDLSPFLQHEFCEEKAVLCYERNAQSPVVEKRQCHVATSAQYFIQETDRSGLTGIEGDVKRFHMRAYSLPGSVLTSPLEVIPSDFDRTILMRKKTGMLSKSSIKGFCRWAPNFLELSKIYRTPTPFLFRSLLRAHKFKCGRVFNWAFNEEDTELFTFLLFPLLQDMREGGLDRCQIGNVEGKQESLKTILERSGFRRIQTTSILIKQLE